jgi:hypothetical protein
MKTFQQKNRLFSWRTNERERCNKNGAEKHIWGEIGYCGVKKRRGNPIILVSHQ